MKQSKILKNQKNFKSNEIRINLNDLINIKRYIINYPNHYNKKQHLKILNQWIKEKNQQLESLKK